MLVVVVVVVVVVMVVTMIVVVTMMVIVTGHGSLPRVGLQLQPILGRTPSGSNAADGRIAADSGHAKSRPTGAASRRNSRGGAPREP